MENRLVISCKKIIIQKKTTTTEKNWKYLKKININET